MATRTGMPLLQASGGAVNGTDKEWVGGKGLLQVTGTFGGATVKLQTKAPDGTYLDVGTDATFTAAGQVLVEIPMMVVRCTTTGGTGSSINATLTKV